MNRERIQQLIDLTFSHPHVFKMSRWLEVANPHNQAYDSVDEIEGSKQDAIACLSLSPKECGTVGCIAGWTLVLFEPDETEDEYETILEAASLRLGIGKYEVGERLFYQDNWPEEFRIVMRAKYDPEFEQLNPTWSELSTATKVRERLEYLLATGT